MAKSKKKIPVEPKKVGRPTKMTEEVLKQLRAAFLIGANDQEAYRYAGVSHETFYNYLEKHPEFREKIDTWKEAPILKAKKTVVKGLDDTKNAQWYLERKKKAEFAIRQELSGADGEPFEIKIIKYDDSDNTTI